MPEEIRREGSIAAFASETYEVRKHNRPASADLLPGKLVSRSSGRRAVGPSTRPLDQPSKRTGLGAARLVAISDS
jgi:hypothetical protein